MRNPHTLRRSPVLGLARLAPIALALGVLPAAFAQPLGGPMSEARRGEGELTRGENVVELVEGSAWLREDGTAFIAARSRRETFEFAGTWRHREREQRLLKITEAMGGRADAEGWVMTKDGQLTQIEIVGRSGGRRLRLHFLATAELPARGPVWNGVDSIRDGDGTLERGRVRQQVQRVRVVLAPGGRAELVLHGRERIRVTGRWHDAGADRVRFEAAGGLDDQRGSGSGTIELRDRRVERVTLSGVSGRRDYRLDFRAAADHPAPPPIGGRPGRQELSELAGYDIEVGNYTSVFFETLRECQGACRRDDRCRAYTYNTRSRTCYLKERLGRYARRADAVSGDKGEGR